MASPRDAKSDRPRTRSASGKIPGLKLSSACKNAVISRYDDWQPPAHGQVAGPSAQTPPMHFAKIWHTEESRQLAPSGTLALHTFVSGVSAAQYVPAVQKT